MFDRLTERLDDVFRKLRGQGRITERNIDDSLREIRRALLEADVNFQVARSFLHAVREKATGREVFRSLTPGQQVVKIVHDELVSLLGRQMEPIKLADHPVRYSETPHRIASVAPELGQHTEEVLLELGYSWPDISRLQDRGVIL